MGHRLLALERAPLPRRPGDGNDPLVLVVSPTNACNLRCGHCYRDEAQAFRHELTPAEHVRVLREFADLAESLGRPGAVVISGGEPLLARHLGLVGRTALAMGLGVRVNTNATLATPAVARGLAAWGIEVAQVSLDGPDRGTHEAVRGPGSWALTRRGTANLLAAGLTVSLKVTLLPGRNDHDPAAYLRVAREWGAWAVSFARAVPVGSGVAWRPYTPAGYRALLERLASGAEPGVVAEVRDATFDRSPCTGARRYYRGEEGHDVIAIDADGTCYASRRMPLRLGNVRGSPLADLWQHTVLERIRAGLLTGKCSRCSLRPACRGGSRAAAWVGSGDPLAPDPACWVEPE